MLFLLGSFYWMVRLSTELLGTVTGGGKRAVSRKVRKLLTRLSATLAVIIAAATIYSIFFRPAGSHAPRPVGGPPPTTTPAPSEQDIYVAKLLKDHQSLDRGALAYSQVSGLNTAQSIQFEVVVTDVGRGRQQIQVTKFNGMSVDQQNVPTGGIVGVQIASCENLTCQSESTIRQPVLQRGDEARWYWKITAGTPGPAKITLRADTYDQDSNQSLSEEIVEIKTKVLPTAAFNQNQNHKKITSAAKNVVTDIETAGSVATAILAIGGVAGWLAHKRRKASHDPDETVKAPPNAPEAPAHHQKSSLDDGTTLTGPTPPATPTSKQTPEMKAH